MKTVVSASRRTDLPAFYTDWLLAQCRRGYAEVTNPVTKAAYTVDLRPESVHSMVLWSKHFGPLLDRIGELSDYELFFMYTLNDAPELEPRVPPLDRRLAQLDRLLDRFGRERLITRCDPIVFWRQGQTPRDNRAGALRVVRELGARGIRRVIMSVMDTRYRKLRRRPVRFVSPPLDEQARVLGELAGEAARYQMTVALCCNAELSGRLDLPNVTVSRCVDGGYLSRVVGEPASRAGDTAQRSECGCTRSRDIGSYEQVCGHRCVYCYAAPG